MKSWMRTITALFIFLLPIFIVPLSGWSVRIDKVILLSIYSFLSVIFLSLELWKVRNNRLGVSFFGMSTSFLLVSAVAASFASITFLSGLQGRSFDIMSSLFIFLLIVSTFAVIRSIESMKEIVLYGAALFGGFFLTLSLQVFRIVLATFINLPVWVGEPVFNLIGKWNDLAVIAGILLLTVILARRSVRFEGRSSVLWYLTLILSVFVLIVVNFKVMFLFVALGSLFFCIEALRQKRKDFGLITILAIVLVLSSVFYIDGSWRVLGNTSASINKLFNISSIEVYPNIASTKEIILESWKENPLIGTGPGSFRDMWRLHKPEGVNPSIFWNNDFEFGIGVIPTNAVTSGILGFLAYIIFSIFILAGSFRLWINSLKYPAGISKFAIQTVASTTAFLWIVPWLYTPSIALYVISWLCAGVLFAALNVSKDSLQTRVISIKSILFAYAVLVIFILASVFSLYGITRQIMAAYHFERAVHVASTTADNSTLNIVFGHLNNAIKWYPQDIYTRAAAETLFAEFNKALSSSTKDTDTERLQNILDSVTDYAKGSVMIDPENAENFLFVAELYRTLYFQGVPGSYDIALDFYNQALSLSPFNPHIYLLRANLYIKAGSLNLAKDDLNKAIALKPNYTEAVSTLVQILLSEGEEKEALAKLEERAVIAPADPGIFFQIGVLNYNKGNYEKAKEALEAAVISGGDYADAMYYLGLTYDKLNREKDALIIFKRIKELNPDVKELIQIIGNLESGREALSKIPETKSEDVPLKETN